MVGLSFNRLSGEIPDAVTSFTDAQTVGMSQIGVSGAIPDAVASWSGCSAECDTSLCLLLHLILQADIFFCMPSA